VTADLDTVFAALADQTRRAIVTRLADGEASVSELAAPFAMSLPAVYKHLGILEEAGLITTEKEGRIRTCRLTADPMRDAVEWLEYYSRFWDQRLDALERFIKKQKKKQSKK
jgi:DNA-binding transcriptional ArsR family regulator